jgi:hypothetical protein
MTDDRSAMRPQDCLKVISVSSTYYPLESRNEEGLTVINSVAFLQQNFSETVNVFRAGQKVVVLQQWNGILFVLSSDDHSPPELLRFLLQMVKDIAVFLFGPHFETFISSKNIVRSLREVYAKYIEKLFEAINCDYKVMAMVQDYDQNSQRLAQQLSKKLTYSEIPPGVSFIECILFKRHKIVGRFSKPGTKVLSATDIFLISLLEKIEFGAIEMAPTDRIESTDSGKVVNKKVNLYMDGSPQQCYISEVQFAPDSPYLLIAALSAQPSAETDAVVSSLATQFATLVNQTPPDPTPLFPTYQITGMLHYLLINRTTGEYRESDGPETDGPEGERQAVLFERIRRRMIASSMRALQDGYLGLIRNEMVFQYTWELKFIGPKGQALFPIDVVKAPKFADGGISYAKIAADVVGADNDATVYELMTVYLGVVSTKDVLDANGHLFDVLTKPPGA